MIFFFAVGLRQITEFSVVLRLMEAVSFVFFLFEEDLYLYPHSPLASITSGIHSLVSC